MHKCHTLHFKCAFAFSVYIWLHYPPPRSRNDSLNILVDLLPPDAPTSSRDNTLISVDINRHKEVIVKAISATLLLLLKHFKVKFLFFVFFLAIIKIGGRVK